MHLLQRVFAVLAVAILAGAASAEIIFSDVLIDGSLGTGATFHAGTAFIDFLFPAAFVGDLTDPTRFGNLTISYNADSSSLISQDRTLVSMLGALSGSGTIYFNEVVEDISDPQHPQVIANYNVIIANNSDLPLVTTIYFDWPSFHIRVKKALALTAEPTQAFDLANVSLIQQTFQVPEPAALLPVFLVAGLMARRR